MPRLERFSQGLCLEGAQANRGFSGGSSMLGPWQAIWATNKGSGFWIRDSGWDLGQSLLIELTKGGANVPFGNSSRQAAEREPGESRKAFALLFVHETERRLIPR